MTSLPLWYRTANPTALARLQLAEAKLPNTQWDMEMQGVSRRLAKQMSQIGSSAVADAFTDDDAYFWGRGVGLSFAAMMRPSLPKSGSLNEIVAVKIEEREFQFAKPTSTGKIIEEQWLEQAWEEFQCVSLIADALTALRSVSLFQTVGKRSAQEKRGVYISSTNPLFTALVDDWDAWRQHPYGCFWGNWEGEAPCP